MAIHLAAARAGTMGRGARFFRERRDICSPVADRGWLPPSAPRILPTDTSYLITGHKSGNGDGEDGGSDVARTLSPSTRFPLVNHGKPYVIGKQRARARESVWGPSSRRLTLGT